VPWSKGGDNAATHPALLAAGAHGDERTLNEVSGFVLRCYLQSAGHMTDYVVDEGTAMLLGQTRWQELVRVAVRAGLMTKVRGRRAWKLLEDPEFVHLRLRADVLWQRQRERDIANPAIVVPVRVRDGDCCRYCSKPVVWKGVRRGNIRGTYDHREPGKAATVGTLVVACGECNSTRGDDPDADQLLPLRPAPLEPYYSADTVEWLAGKGIYVTPGPQPAGAAGAAGAAASAQRALADTAGAVAGAAGSAQRPAPTAAAGAAPEGAQRAAPRSADPAGQESQARDGSGRDGTGPPTSHLPTSPAPPTNPSSSRARRRGGRGRGARRTSHEEQP